ncbi:MAG: RNAse Z [Bacteroidetes bacterium]|nr:MAG: RNAse Z [Bacteroidota bacterium]
MNLTITGSSTALFSTWYFIEELGILFDAGDGVISGLNQKVGKIKHAFISHPDRDHLSALYRLNPLNDRIQIYYPKDAGSFPALETFSKHFDPDKKRSDWQGIVDQENIFLRNDLKVVAVRNEHIAADIGIHKSLSFKVSSCKKKLKKEYINLSQEEIKNLIAEQGKDYLLQEETKPIITYSGDTPVDDYSRFDNSNILIHEATFLDSQNDRLLVNARNKHSSLEEVIEMVANIKINHLILGHFSLRYSQELIDSEIVRLSKKFNLKIPVHRLKTGTTHRNILTEEPIYSS